MQFDKDIASDHKDIFEAVREILLSVDGMVETKKPRITTYSISKSGVCHLRTMPHGVDIGFLKGVQMQDKYGALSGHGKKIRVLSLKEIDSEMIKYYLKQAIKIIS